LNLHDHMIRIRWHMTHCECICLYSDLFWVRHCNCVRYGDGVNIDLIFIFSVKFSLPWWSRWGCLDDRMANWFLRKNRGRISVVHWDYLDPASRKGKERRERIARLVFWRLPTKILTDGKFYEGFDGWRNRNAQGGILESRRLYCGFQKKISGVWTKG